MTLSDENYPAKNRILIVDDDTMICRLLSTYLGRHGFDSLCAHSGEEALALLAETTFSTVITDLKMGNISGQEVLRRVKSTQPDTRVVMITGSCNEADKKEAYQNGVDDFLHKPFSMKAILSCLLPSSQR